MLTKIRCNKKGNDQFIDWDKVIYIEVADTSYGGGMVGGETEYAEYTFGMNSGHILQVTIERAKFEKLSAGKTLW